MGRLVSEQDSSPLERCDFTRDEIEAADKARIAYEGWVEIKDVTFTDKGFAITYESDPFDECAPVDDIKRLK